MTQLQTSLQAPSVAVSSASGGFMIDPPDVQRFLILHGLGWGVKRIARELGTSPNTVRSYLRQGEHRPYSRPSFLALHPHRLWLFERLEALGGNARVLLLELADKGVVVSYPTLARFVQPWRAEREAKARATVRFETLPGQQCQVDFGELFLYIATVMTKVYFCVLTLGYSRRCFVKAFLAERLEHWTATLDAGFLHFGGVPHELLIDNAGALVDDHNVKTGQVLFNKSFLSFCGQHGTKPRACRPFRARTKGKVESGVGYVKGNALADKNFESFEALEEHLVKWTKEVSDVRVHGTTHERPIDRFPAEQKSLLPLKSKSPILIPLQRIVASDCFVDVATNRYSVPYQYIGRKVEALVKDGHIIVRCDNKEIARHLEAKGRHQCVMLEAHHLELRRVTLGRAKPSTPLVEPISSEERRLAFLDKLCQGGE